MLKFICFFVALAVTPQCASASPAAASASSQTVSGIALDAQWKRALYAFAREKLLHPAWGWSHSERDYQLATKIAAKEGLRIDPDILFAAAFTHDIGAIGDFQKEGVDHAVRSADLVEPLLSSFGFPSSKIPAVREAILGHMFDKKPGASSEALVLHDADTIDFLGVVGVARRLSLTGSAVDYAGGVAKLRDFAERLPEQTITRTARRMADERAGEMRQFLDRLRNETADGKLP
jgi:uncharacterized protein